MIKAWSYIEEYKDLRKKILKSVDKALSSGKIFFSFNKAFVESKIKHFPYQITNKSFYKKYYKRN